MKCDKCNGTGHIGNPIRDRFNQPVEFDSVLIATVPKWTTKQKGSSAVFEFSPALLVQKERCVDLGKGVWEIDAVTYYVGNRHHYTFSGEIDKSCPDFITLNKSLEDMQAEGNI